jgi:hypothetical protein
MATQPLFANAPEPVKYPSPPTNPVYEPRIWPGILAFAYFLLAAFPAHALTACFIESAGHWTGPIDIGALVNLDTDFKINPDGTMSGGYEVHDVIPYRGTLTNFHQNGPCSASFIWHDHFGSGLVQIDFAPERGQFDGKWGTPHSVPTYVFDGFRAASEPLS